MRRLLFETWYAFAGREIVGTFPSSSGTGTYHHGDMAISGCYRRRLEGATENTNYRYLCDPAPVYTVV